MSDVFDHEVLMSKQITSKFSVYVVKLKTTEACQYTCPIHHKDSSRSLLPGEIVGASTNTFGAFYGCFEYLNMRFQQNSENLYVSEALALYKLYKRKEKLKEIKTLRGTKC